MERGAKPLPGRAKIAWLAWFAYALTYFTLGFTPGIVRSDDFGYLRSILGVLGRGRPYVYDWLEPYGAVFSTSCALLYKLTGSFLFSTWGFQAFCVLALYPLLYFLIAARLAHRSAALVALALCTFPIFFAKEADFHAGICTLDLFLAALCLYERGRLGWFFLPAFLAFANRQNHVCLLVLPVWAVLSRYRINGTPRSVLIGFALYLAAAAILVLSMNPTYAGVHAAFRHAGPLRMIGPGILALLAGSFMTLGCLALFSALRGRAPGWGSGARRWLAPLAAALSLAALMPFWHASLIRTDTPLFGYAGWPQVNRALPWMLLGSLWCLDFRLLRPSPYLLLAAGFVAVASLRGIWWDYYFLEISILCLLLAMGKPKSDAKSDAKSEVTEEVPTLSRPSLALLCAVLAGNLAYAYLLKIQSDKQALSVRTLERLQREGRAPTDAMTGATFGYLGWKVFDWFIANEGRTYGELADFMGYVRRDRITVETGLPWRKGFRTVLPESAVPLDSGECAIGFAKVRYRVADLRGPDSGQAIMGRRMDLDPGLFRPPRFPLNAGEWSELVESGRSVSRKSGL